MPQASVESLFCYPVKGLSPQRLEAVDLVADAYFPNDRLYAVENGPSGHDPERPAHLPKTKFLMLMRNERLARLKSVYDAPTRRLRVDLDGTRVCEADLSRPEGRGALETFLSDFCREDLRGPLRVLVTGESFRFTDSPKGFVSLVNLNSVKAVEQAVGRAVDPLRFRANLYLGGMPAWTEHGLVGERLTIGDTLLEVVATTQRCAATAVDPSTGARDMPVVATLMQTFGHNLCGVYARVLKGGTLRPGAAVSLPG